MATSSHGAGVDPAKLIGRWGLPVLGMIRTLPSYSLPDGALYSASNVLIHGGRLQPRPGLTLFHATTFVDRITGVTEYRNAAGNSIPVAGGRQRQYKYDAGTWTDITGSLQTATADQLARFASIEFSSPAVVYLIHVNGVDTPSRWTGSSNFVNMSGSPSVWSDVCNAYDRIVGVKAPYEVSWGEQAAIDRWPALNRRFLGDTPDPVVACQSLGVYGLVVLKQRSIWVGVPTAGSSAFAFRFEPRGEYDGPCSPAAVIQVDGVLYWLTIRGQIAAYDGGAKPQWIAGGLWPYLLADMDPTNTARAFGWYDSALRTVNFCYARSGDAGECKGLVTINLPFPEHGVESNYPAFPGLLGKAVSAAGRMRLSDNTEPVIAFTSATIKSYKVEGSTDDTVAIAGHWQTPLTGTPGLVPMRLDAIAPFFERGEGYGLVTLKAVVSDVLDAPGGTIIDTPTQTFDLTTLPVRDEKALVASGRFHGVRFEFASAGTIRYSGALLYATPLQ